MRNRRPAVLSEVEKEIIGEIQALRAAPQNAQLRDLLEHPARLVYYFIQASHGHVKLRMNALAPALGSEMRTLQRAFADEYCETFTARQARVRLDFSCWTLGISPPSKISALASLLGYARVQDFTRFFKKHMHQSPTEWGHMERERIERERKQPAIE